MRRPGLVALVVVFPLLAACASEGAASPAKAAVTVRTFQFRSTPLRVAPGTTVTWTNKDQILHTVSAGTRQQPAPEAFDGQLDGAGATFSHTFATAGTFAYHCS